MTSAFVLSCALILDALLGEPQWLWRRVPHPAVLMGRLVRLLEERLNNGANQRAKGILAVALLVCVAAIIGTLLSVFGPLVEVVIAAILLAHKSLISHVSAVAEGLRLSLVQGRRAVSLIVSRDTAAMDAPAIARSAIESGAENLSDAVVAPAFWFLIGGLPGILIYKAVNTADSMIGYRTERYAAFGWAAARLDDVLNWIPARLTAGMIAVSGGVLRQWRQIRADAGLHRSPNAGWPEAAMARAIGVALAGPRAYDGAMQPFAWVNEDGKMDLGAADIDAALRQMWRAWGILLSVTAVLAAL